MLSTVAGICQKPDVHGNYAHKAAALFDAAGLVTAVVLGVLAVSGVGGLPIGATGGTWLLGGGLVGLAILTAKNTLSCNPSPNSWTNASKTDGGKLEVEWIDEDSDEELV